MTTPSLLKNTFRVYVFSYLAAPLGYLTRLIISHDISIQEVGVLYSLLGFMGILSSYSGLGIIEALKYFIPKLLIQQEHSKLKSIILTSFISQITMSSILGGFLYFWADRLANSYFQTNVLSQILPYYIIYLFGANILQLLSAIFFGFQDSFSAKIMDFLMTLFILLFTFTFSLTWEGGMILYAIIPIVALLLSITIGIVLYIKNHHHRISSAKTQISRSLLKEFFTYSWWTFLTVNINILLNTIDQQLVLLLSGALFAGLYTNYISLQNLTLILVSPIAMLLTPLFTGLITQGSMEKLHWLLRTIYTNIWKVTVILSSFLFLFWPTIAILLFGEQYLASWLLLRYAAPFYIFTIFASFNFTLLASNGKIKERTLSLIKIIPIYLLLNFLLIPQFAIYGAIIAGIISKILTFLITYQQTSPLYPSIQRKEILKTWALSLVLSSLLYLIESQIQLLSLPNRGLSFLLLCGYGLLYLGIMGLLYRSSFQELYTNLKSH